MFTRTIHNFKTLSGQGHLRLLQPSLTTKSDASFVDQTVGRQPPTEPASKMHKQSRTQSHSTNAAAPLASVAWSVLLALFKFGVLGSAVYLLSCDLNVFFKEYVYGMQEPYPCPAGTCISDPPPYPLL